MSTKTLTLLTVLGLAACSNPPVSAARLASTTTDSGRSIHHFQAADGTVVDAAADVQETDNDGLARNAVAVGITVTIVPTRPATSIRVVLTNVCQDAGSEDPYREAVQADAQPQGATFVATLPAEASGTFPLFSYTAGGTDTTCTQELSVVADGVWLTDPVNGTHNFTFSF